MGIMSYFKIGFLILNNTY